MGYVHRGVDGSKPRKGVYIKDWGRGEYKWFMDLGLGWDWILTALSDDTEAVILEVSEAISTALDEFHFSMEAFGDAIVFGEAPDGSERLTP